MASSGSARITATSIGSTIRGCWRAASGRAASAYFDTQGEGVPGLPRIRVEQEELWVATMPGTFYVLKFADGVLDPIVQD
jgi:hypothetical protein